MRDEWNDGPEELAEELEFLAGAIEALPPEELRDRLLDYATSLSPEERAYLLELLEEDWTDLDEVDALFERADAAFDAGDMKLAAGAYLIAFGEIEDEDDADLLQTDLDPALARYLRAFLELVPAAHRSRAFLETLEEVGEVAALYRPVDEMLSAGAVAPEWRDRFLDDLIRDLTDGDAEAEVPEILPEAIGLRHGPEGLRALARGEAGGRSEVWSELIWTHLERGDVAEAAEVAEEGLLRVDRQPEQAVLAERAAEFWQEIGHAERAMEMRRRAFRAEPSLSRLDILLDVAEEAGLDMDEVVAGERDAWHPRGSAEARAVKGRLDLLAADHAAVADLLRHSKATGWTWEASTIGAAYAYSLAAAAGEIPEGSAIDALWEDIDTYVADASFGMHLLDGLARARIGPADRERYLEVAREKALARVRKIVEGQHRDAYGRAARALVGWAEAVTLAGDAEAGRAAIETAHEEFPRHSAFRSELTAWTERSPVISGA